MRVFADTTGSIILVRGDSLRVLAGLPPESFDVVFADPPYFLSNGGTTCRAGKNVRVDKGDWDRSRGADDNHEFNVEWLAAVRRVLRPNGTIWISGTHHSIHSVGFALQQLDFRILNEIVWEKTAPPPNLGCRCFTHAHETLLWAAKSKRSRYHFAYAAMKAVTGKQMKSVWRLNAPPKSEKLHGRHPTQKPIELVARILRASARPGARVLDPFNGSGTTAVVASRLALRYVGIDLSADYIALTRRRLEAEGHRFR